MSNRNPLVYIILPIYNGRIYFLEQLMSIYHQNYKNWYLIIVNDWSTDSSQGIAKKFVSDYKLKNKVKIVKKENGGLNSAITRWFEEIKKMCDVNKVNSLISYCDCDDIRTREKLAVQVKYMIDNHECWVSYHDLAVINENWRLINPSRLNMIYKKDLSFLYWSTFGNQITATTMIFKTNLIEYILPMPNEFWISQDRWTILVLSLNKIRIWFINEALAYYRKWHQSMERAYMKESINKRNNARLNLINSIQNRFPDKDISYIVKYNKDRYWKWPKKWYSLIHIYFLMLLKYPKLFIIWLYVQTYRFLNFWLKIFKEND